MKYIFGLLFLILIALFETSVLPFFPIFGTSLNFLLIILLALEFLGLTRESYYGAFFGGILLDLLTGSPFGLSSLVLLLLTGAVGLAQRVAEGSPLALLLITFAVSTIFRFVQIFPTLNVATLLKGGLLDTMLMLVLYPSLRYLLKSVFGRKELEIGT